MVLIIDGKETSVFLIRYISQCSKTRTAGSIKRTRLNAKNRFGVIIIKFDVCIVKRKFDNYGLQFHNNIAELHFASVDQDIKLCNNTITQYINITILYA